MSANLRHAAGSLMVVGLAGSELAGLERAWLKLVRPAGIILFRRNITEPGQTRALLSDATELCAPHSLRCVDVEGGQVDRLRDALAPLPSPQAVFLAAQRTGKAGLMRQHGELAGRAVRAFGFNTTLAPVLDLSMPASVAVMGTRCASPAADGVFEFARAFLSGLADVGVAGCGKHFPGLGAGTLDSHLETPKIERSAGELWRQDLVPYRELGNELPLVMVSHAAYPLTPGGSRPASVSKYWIETVLRKRIGYRGIVFSDDLEMGGILGFLSIEEAAVEAIRAGMNLIEICHSPELILRAYEALIVEGERSAGFRRLLLERAVATARLRSKAVGNRISTAPTTKQFEALRSRVLRFGDTVAMGNANGEEQPA